MNVELQKAMYQKNYFFDFVDFCGKEAGYDRKRKNFSIYRKIKKNSISRQPIVFGNMRRPVSGNINPAGNWQKSWKKKDLQ